MAQAEKTIVISKSSDKMSDSYKEQLLENLTDAAMKAYIQAQGSPPHIMRAHILIELDKVLKEQRIYTRILPKPPTSTPPIPPISNISQSSNCEFNNIGLPPGLEHMMPHSKIEKSNIVRIEQPELTVSISSTVTNKKKHCDGCGSIIWGINVMTKNNISLCRNCNKSIKRLA